METSQKSINWGEIVGNNFSKSVLERYLLTEKIPHCIIFAGKEGIGKMTIAMIWSRIVLCNQRVNHIVSCGKCYICRNNNFGNNKKLFLVREESKILIDQVRKIKNDLSRSDFDGGYRVVIIENAERMTNEAVNAFLKIMEEPGKNIVFILITSRIDKLKDTIKSRSAILHFDRLHRIDIDNIVANQKSSWESEELYKLSMGRPEVLNRLIKTEKNASIQNVEKFWRLVYADVAKKAALAKQIEKMNSDRIVALFLFWESCLRDLLLYKIGDRQSCWWQDKNLFELYLKIPIDPDRIEQLCIAIAGLRNIIQTSVSKKIQVFNLLINFNL